MKLNSVFRNSLIHYETDLDTIDRLEELGLIDVWTASKFAGQLGESYNKKDQDAHDALMIQLALILRSSQYAS